ncbi:hypothetical protein JTB14_034343 [Gonioctena quinquepunctata]|nr:hypothetical protein JTB14_034343 [Gonioctena quinquepunctata]
MGYQQMKIHSQSLAPAQTVITGPEKRTVYFHDKLDTGPLLVYVENNSKEFRDELNPMKGIIKGVELDYPEEYIEGKMKPFDMHCRFKVEYVQRMHVEDDRVDGTETLIPTETILVVFNSQQISKYITNNHLRIPFMTYEQKVLLCYSGFRYGHLGKQCRSDIRCPKCLEDHYKEEC